MSSITNAQNLITNVFRPVYIYDGTLQTFTPKLELSNVDTYIGNEVRVFRDQVGDQSNNVYVGSNAGNSYLNINSNSQVTAVGANAGANISNVSNSVYFGYGAGSGSANANAVIAIGANAFGGGTSNILIGNGPGSNVGSNNILIGHGISTFASPTSNKLQIGNLIYGNFSNKWVGIGTPTQPLNYVQLDISGGVFVDGKMGIQMTPSNSLNVNGVTQSTSGLYSTASVAILAGSTSNIIGDLATGNINTLQTGNILVSAQDSLTLGTNYYSQMILVSDPASAPVSMYAVSNGYTSIVYSGGKIILSNTDTASHTFAWSITRFPQEP